MIHIAAEFALTAAARRFSAYGPSHWVALAVFAIGCAALIWIGRRQSESEARLLGRILGAVAAAVFLADLVFKLLWSPDAERLPLQLCDFACVAGAYALWSQRHWAFALTYYWGLLLSTQALITPVLNAPDFPNYRFLVFWTLHLLVVWAPIYLTWGRGMRPRWGDYRFAVIITLTWAALIIVFNVVAGTNYGFLNRKPAHPTMLDVLGPWPMYVPLQILIIIAAWALMTWPWERKRRDETSDVADVATR